MCNHRLLQPFIVTITLVLFAGLAALIKWPAQEPVAKTEPPNAYGQLPLSFEARDDARFIARGPGYSIGLKADEAVMRLRVEDRGSRIEGRGASSPLPLAPSSILNTRSSILRMKLINADSRARAKALEPLAGKINYLLGADPRAWRTNLPTYARVRYASVYPGIDLVYYGNQQRLEYDFVVAPGADPGAIELGFEGADKIEVDAQGDLVLHTAGGAVRQHKPVIYQETDGERKEISGEYALTGDRQVRFHIGDYDAGRLLVIDPVLAYSTYFGSSGAEDVPGGIAVDAAGQIYLVGTTGAADFPTANPAQGNLKGKADVFIAKLNAAGNALVYSTYLGGSNGSYVGGGGAELGLAIAVDAMSNAYITGLTSSNDFPRVNALQANYGGGDTDGFVTKLSANGGSFVYSTYLGGSGNENHTFLQKIPFPGVGIAVDTAGNAYVAGTTTSSNFPTRNPLRGTFGGVADAYVAKINATGNALVYSTYLGGSGDELCFGLAVDAAGNAYVDGASASTDFPLANPLQSSLKGESDAFITKLNAAGNALIYSTYLGGGSVDLATGIAADAAGNAYVFGLTGSNDYPTAQPFQSSRRGDADTFVARISEQGGPPPAGTVASVSAANYLGPQLAPESIAAAFGGGLATRIEVASSLPLPTNLAGTTVTVKDGAGQDRLAPLFFVAPGQINFQVPPGTPTGQATITVMSGAGQVSRGTAQIVSTAAGLFSADASGQGLASAVVLRVRASGEQVYEPVTRFDQGLNRFVAVPIDLGPQGDQLFLILFGTGMRFRTNASASIGGTDSAVLYVGPSIFVGLDQCNVNLPRSLAGRGEVNVAMTVDGRAVNTVRASFR